MEKKIAAPSVMSLRIEMWWQNNHLATGTGFVVRSGDQAFLITNRHNLDGLGSDGRPRSTHGVTPDKIRILHNAENQLLRWQWKVEPLVDAENQPLWREHPIGGKEVDVVALELHNLEGVDLYPYSLNSEDPPVIEPSAGLNIIGFPYAESSGGGMGIWARGTVASEPNLSYGKWPQFLIDSRTRPGQSGSPVIFFVANGIVQRSSGTTGVYQGHVFHLFGVYSGRINKESDIGIVWKTSIIQDIIASPLSTIANNALP